MANKQLTQIQYEEIKALHDREDRTGAYLKYYEFTGSQQTLRQAKISQFSGFIGGIAELANKVAELHPNYPKGQVIEFSKLVEQDWFNTLTKKHNEHKVFDDSEMLRTAQETWARMKLEEFFPGNSLIAAQQVFEGEILEALKSFSTPGTLITTFSSIVIFETLSSIAGNGIISFLSHKEKYEHKVTPDLMVAYLIDRTTGHVVYVEDTGARKIGKNSWIVEGISKEQVAQSYSIDIDRISEAYPESVFDILVNDHSNREEFIIFPEVNTKHCPGLENLVGTVKRYLEEDADSSYGKLGENYRDAYLSLSYKKFGTFASGCNQLKEFIPPKLFIKLCEGGKSMFIPNQFCNFPRNLEQEFINKIMNSSDHLDSFKARAKNNMLTQTEIEDVINSKNENYNLFAANFLKIQSMLMEYYEEHKHQIGEIQPQHDEL
jgi:hypothetical protein